MVLEALALLRAEPIHEETELPMYLHYSDSHDAGDRKCSSASRQSRNQHDPAEKLAGDGQKGEYGGDSQMLQKTASSHLNRTRRTSPSSIDHHERRRLLQGRVAQRERVILFRLNESFQHKFILSFWGAHERRIRSVLRPCYRSTHIAGIDAKPTKRLRSLDDTPIWQGFTVQSDVADYSIEDL
jgi:hypothetical protein